MGNMPVIRDLIVDMDAVHWKKIQRVTPWLINKEPVPEREYIVPHENMVDVTQTMACIQCGACVSDCLSMEVDPLFVGPAALAKAYRFVGDPARRRAVRAPQGPLRGRARHLRLHPLLQLHRRLSQGRRADEPDHAPAPRRRVNDEHIEDRNNGHRHENAFVKNIERNGLLHEADLLPDSYGGKFHPRAVPELLGSLPVAAKAMTRGKMSLSGALLHPHKASPEVKQIFKKVEGEKRALRAQSVRGRVRG